PMPSWSGRRSPRPGRELAEARRRRPGASARLPRLTHLPRRQRLPRLRWPPGPSPVRASALDARIGETSPDSGKEVFALLRDFATSEDGALHAEKYYGTTSDEFASMRPAFRWRQIVALARVSASQYGYPAPGHKEACELLKG